MTTDTTISAPLLIRLHANDNVLIARQPIAIGQQLPEFGLRMRSQVPAGHKIAARDIAAGEELTCDYNVFFEDGFEFLGDR